MNITVFITHPEVPCWNFSEDNLKYMQEELPGRSVAALRYRASVLGFSITRGTVSLSLLAKETGYNWKQFLRAKKALKQDWARLTPVAKNQKSHSKYLISGNQAIDHINEHDEVLIEGVGGSQRGPIGSQWGLKFKVVAVNGVALSEILSGKKQKPAR